jgi:hypothetical protein
MVIVAIISAKSSALLQIATPESLTDRIIIIENIIRVLSKSDLDRISLR